MSADFMSFVIPMDSDAAEALLATLEPLEESYEDHIYLTSPADLLEAMGASDDGVVTLSTNYAAIVALDRFVAAPAGRSLLEGRAVRRIPAADVKRFRARLQGLLLRSGGHDGVADELGPRLDRHKSGRDDAVAMIEGLEAGTAAALEHGADLLIAGSVA